MATCEYERQREQRIADNRRRMEEMGIFTLKNQLHQTAQMRSRANQPQRRVPSANRADRKLVNVPKRKSSRLEGKPATNYNESALDVINKGDRKHTRSNLLDRHVVSQEEVYTEEHIKLLREYEEPWELFVDGYDAQGNRIYDRVTGMTCHQCRQKTLGRHTSCSQCQTLHGVFCGDCLFMRYGENILEVQAKGEWVCPPCRGLCNCSFHRIRNGWAPTGTLYRRAIAEGYKSVAHYLVLTKQGDPAAEAESAPADAAGAIAAVSPPQEAPAAHPDSLPATSRSRRATRATPAELPIVEARVSEAAPVEPPHQDGNAAADAAPRKGRGKKAADSVKAAPRQAQIDTILVKAKRATGAAKSLAGKALSKVAELAGIGEGRGLGQGRRGSAAKQPVSRTTRTTCGQPKALGVKKNPGSCIQKRSNRSRS